MNLRGNTNLVDRSLALRNGTVRWGSDRLADLTADGIRNIHINGFRSYTDSVSSSNPTDTYRLQLSRTMNFRAALDGLRGGADLTLLDSQRNVIQRSTQAGNASEFIGWCLSAGTYYIEVAAKPGNNTPYQLRISALSSHRRPEIHVGLAANAATFNSGMTGDPTIIGNIRSRRRIVDFRAGFDNAPFNQYTSVMSSLGRNGQFVLNAAQLNQIYGSALPNGTHTLYFQAIDSRGNISSAATFSFTSRQSTLQPSFDLNRDSDSGFLGDRRTVYQTVTLSGQADANAALTLQNSGLTTVADANGRFQFANVSLSLGNNVLTVRARDQVGNENTYTTTIAREAEQSNPFVRNWNTTLLQAIATDRTAPPRASRAMAIMNTAIYDAVNSITDAGSTYRLNLTAPAGASAEAAAAQAAYQTLVSLFPAQTATFAAALTASLALIPDGQSEQDGVAIGNAVANAILAWRSTDGATATVTYTPLGTPGSWQPTPTANAAALLPQWPNVTPFAMTTGSQFRPAGPPAYNSTQYANELEQVRNLGSSTNSTRTADQTQIAFFWADGAGTFTPPGHWDTIAQQIARDRRTTLQEDARLFALMSIAVADAGIAAWDAKYHYNQWRPITALRDTVDPLPWTPDPTWTPLLATPPFPDYISGHSTFSAAASTVLATLFGDNTSFTATADSASAVSGVVRSFSSFSQAANEAGMSRIYGGIHVMSANVDGLTTGRALGNYVVQNFIV